MQIKKFTQFILENEYYDTINEGDIVSGVSYNSSSSSENGTMSVVAKTGEPTEIYFLRNNGADDKARVRFILKFVPSTKPYEIKESDVNAYAFIVKDEGGSEGGSLAYPVAITKMDNFYADKSGSRLQSNSIDLLGQFIAYCGANNAALGSNLAKVIATLLLDNKYNLVVADTFKKFANSIIMNVRNQTFLPTMGKDLASYKSQPGMKAFVTQLPKSCDALKPPKKV